MRARIVFLLLMGILLGPVYYAYTLLFSGTVTQTIRMTDRAERWVTPDGSILRFSNGMAYKPVVLTLTPEMNRVSLRLNFAYEDVDLDGIDANRRYQASLSQLDHTILERPFVVRAKRGTARSIDVGPMEITYPAEYLFILEEIGDAKLAPSLTLEVVANVDTPVRPVIWAGMGLLFIAVIMTLRDLLRTVKSRRSR
jgi:hypothetical protein